MQFVLKYKNTTNKEEEFTREKSKAELARKK